MDCVILVPRRPDLYRDKLWAFVREQVAEEFYWPIVEGVDDGDAPMNRAAARNRAAEQAGDWDVAIFLDADTVPDFYPVRVAVERAAETGKLVCPQNIFRSLSRQGTRDVLAGKCALEDAPKRWDYPNPKSSCIVIGRDLWEATGGYDERFEGWGAEDAAFYAACQALGGVERLEGVCRHCWHPRSPEKNEGLPEYKANFALLDRYKAARHDAEAMRTILSEPGGPLASAGSFFRGGVVPAGASLASVHAGEHILTPEQMRELGL